MKMTVRVCWRFERLHAGHQIRPVMERSESRLFEVNRLTPPNSVPPQNRARRYGPHSRIRPPMNSSARRSET